MESRCGVRALYYAGDSRAGIVRWGAMREVSCYSVARLDQWRDYPRAGDPQYSGVWGTLAVDSRLSPHLCVCLCGRAGVCVSVRVDVRRERVPVCIMYAGARANARVRGAIRRAGARRAKSRSCGRELETSDLGT